MKHPLSAPILLSLLPLLSFAAPPSSSEPRHEATSLPPLPPGLTLPVTLKESLHAGRTAPGQSIQAVTTQRVLLPGALYLNAGAHLLGTVVASSMPAQDLCLQFVTLVVHGRSTPISVRAVAVANFTDVSDTALPAQGSTDRANSNPANWTTRQIGGDEVFRSGWSGDLINATTHTVGFADFHGVYAFPRAPGEPPRTLGPFSATAAGLFGKSPDCSLQSPGALITIHCTASQPELHRGDNLLLEVLPSPRPGTVR